MSVIDINSRTRYPGKLRPGATGGPAAEGDMASSGDGLRDGFAGMPISPDLAADLRVLNDAVRDAPGRGPQTRPEGGAVSHVSAMLHKMRGASADEHDRKFGHKAAGSDFKSWHEQIELAKQAMMDNRASLDDGIAGSAGENVSIVPIFSVETPDVLDSPDLWRNPEIAHFVTSVAVGHPMRKDIALGVLDSYGDIGEMLGRNVKVNIQGVSFACMISQSVIDAVGAGVTLSSVIGRALQKAIRQYALIANGDVIDAILDGATLNIRYVGGAKKPILVSAFSDICPAAEAWSTDVSMADPESYVRVVASPIDGVFAEVSRSCISVRRRQFVNDNALGLPMQESAGDGPVQVLDYSAATTVSDKRSIIQQAAMAMIRKAKQPPEKGK